ncbi:VanZ family protein [Corynebacterium camporealensis]
MTSSSRHHRLPDMPQVNAPRRQAVVTSVLVLLMVLAATLAKPFMDIPGIIDGSAHAQRSLDLEMFNGFENPKVAYGPWLNTLGNVALFMPLGAALIALGQRMPRFRFGMGGTLLFALLLSLSIETAQYIFALGFTDLDDLVLNTLGALIGALWMSKLHTEQQRRVLRMLRWIAVVALVISAGGILWGAIA